MDRQGKEYPSTSSDVYEPTLVTNARQRTSLIEWINSVLPDTSLSINASDEELRAFLLDGTVLCRILNKLRLGSVTECGASNRSSESRSENGSMKIVLECLLTLREQFMPNVGGYNLHNSNSVNNSESDASMKWKRLGERLGNGVGSIQETSPRAYPSAPSGEERRKGGSGSKFQRALRSPVMAEPSAALLHHVGHKFHEVFQMKQGNYADLPAAKISEMMKPNSLDNAPTQSLLSLVNQILDESNERKNVEIPHRVACLLRKVVQEIEMRITTQAEHLRTQNNLFRSREEKYQSRIRVLEALATGTSEETEIVMNQLQQIKTEKTKMDEKKKLEEQDKERLIREEEHNNQEIATLKHDLEVAKKTYEQRCLQMETEAKGAQQELEERLKEAVHLLTESRSRVKEFEAYSESKFQRWTKKEHNYQIFTGFQLGALQVHYRDSCHFLCSDYKAILNFGRDFQELRSASQSIRQEILETQKSYSEEFNRLGTNVKALKNAAESYYAVLAENRKLHNEVQELKGNIRVYCRIRPFLSGQMGKQSIVEYVGENGELAVVNPSKQGKEGRRSFKFNKVYGPAATQAEVFLDTRPLIQSVLDGYNVCIFAYGQTGSGKTYTMTGPEGASEEDWGVNYRALNDLFQISQARKSTFAYEIAVQMVEIYNEQVRDLLSGSGSQKRYPFHYALTCYAISKIMYSCFLYVSFDIEKSFCFLDLHTLGILSTSQPSGLAVPDATMQPVNSTSDVLELMEIGLKNRAKGATALNERSSRSHSVLTIHVRGMDLKTTSYIRGSLHLVDLAGSERVDRSEVTGDRLKEAQHINKSLSALGDVIFALAQKSPHVPYRNSKLTQVLQTSLGGQAKTLMFVQLNPDVSSFSESVSTLKFAERVSGVELGAARSSKDGRDVRELMDQVVSLKDTIAKKDEEIERLQLLKDLKNVYQGVNGEKRGAALVRYGSSSPSRNSIGGTPQRNLKSPGGKGSGLIEKAASDPDNFSENSDMHSAASSQQSLDDFKQRKESLRQSNSSSENIGQNFSADAESLAYGDAEYDERLSDTSDGGLSMGTDTDVSVEGNFSQEGAKPTEDSDKPKTAPRAPRPPLKSLRDSTKGST
ncbi:hypothetical protein RJ640_023978, partial [Escallonia rubra]